MQSLNLQARFPSLTIKTGFLLLPLSAFPFWAGDWWITFSQISPLDRLGFFSKSLFTQSLRLEPISQLQMFFNKIYSGGQRNVQLPNEFWRVCHFKYGTAVEHDCQIFAEFARPRLPCQILCQVYFLHYIASNGQTEPVALTKMG